MPPKTLKSIFQDPDGNAAGFMGPGKMSPWGKLTPPAGITPGEKIPKKSGFNRFSKRNINPARAKKTTCQRGGNGENSLKRRQCTVKYREGISIIM
jgi:hypothetical protein